jgi:hypothetical protein
LINSPRKGHCVIAKFGVAAVTMVSLMATAAGSAESQDAGLRVTTPYPSVAVA